MDFMVFLFLLCFGSPFILLFFATYIKGLKPVLVSRKSLHGACENGNIILVKKHLDNEVGINILVKKYGFAPLHYAAQGGYKEIVELLIENTAARQVQN
ncbi:MAG: ankyrin repeat domain-containing protein [Verrucomicrobiota bacterium]|jgi:hypothetical protein|nr:ankyrin repeat domain-containing protein [Verrucomicrobiota bacterium]